MKPWSLFFVFAFLSSSVFAAEGFRIETDLRLGNGAPIRSTTLFDGAVFYDFIGANGEITVFDLQNDTFTLIDPALRLQTNLVASETKQIVDAQRIPLQANKNGFIAFSAKPSFTMEFDESGGLMVLQSPWIDYSLTTKAFPDAETARIYFDFCDWSCYLNRRINPGLPTPLIRLEVNRILREKKRFPESMKISVFPKGKKFFAKEETFQTSHEFTRHLSNVDRQRIGSVHEARRTFTVLPFVDYQAKIAEKVAAEKK